MMKKYIALVIVIAILGGGAYATQKWFSESFAPAIEVVELSTTTTAQHTPEKSEVVQKTTTVEKSEETNAMPSLARHYTIPVLEESSTLEAMSAHAATSDFSFSGREFAGLGLLVEEIGGLRNADGFYWSLYINNELSEKGVSSARVAPLDTVEWRYQKGV